MQNPHCADTVRHKIPERLDLMKLKGTRRLKRKVGISIYLNDAEHAVVEQRSKQDNLSISAFVANLVRESVIPDQQPRLDEIGNALSILMARMTKLERLQRTLVLNTAYARGYVMGAARTSPSESRKTIEQEMAKFYDKQREFFFELYPEQRDGETKEARS